MSASNLDVDKFIYNENKEYLSNIPTFLYINLDKAVERRKYITNLFKEYNINNIRIKAVDTYHKNYYPYMDVNKFTIYEYACLMSHLKAIEFFYNELDENECIICEDDICFDLLKYYSKSFNEYINECPYDYDIINLFNGIGDTLKCVKFKHKSHWATHAYLITKKGAKKILDRIPKRDNKYDFTNIDDIPADFLLYFICDKVYIKSLITMRSNNNSQLHPDHIEIFQEPKRKLNVKLWKIDKFINSYKNIK